MIQTELDGHPIFGRYVKGRSLIVLFERLFPPYRHAVEAISDCIAPESYRGSHWGVMNNMPMEALRRAVVASWPNGVNELGHTTWDEYHRWYIQDDHMPNHGESLWPIFLSSDLSSESPILDGWHRFHFYDSKGLHIVPVMWRERD